MNWSTFPTLFLIHFIISSSAILSSLSLSYFIPFSNRFLMQPLSSSLTPSLSAFPTPSSSLPPSVPHNFASYPFSPSLSLIMSFSSLSSDIETLLCIWLYLILENIHAYLGISIYLVMHISAYFLFFLFSPLVYFGTFLCIPASRGTNLE